MRRILLCSLGGLACLWPVLSSGHPLDHLKTTNDIGLNKVPHKGVSKILVIPSRVGTATFPPGRWAELKTFYAPQGGAGTFRGYWQIVSNGLYDPVPTLVQPVLYPNSCPIPGKSPADCYLGLNDLALLGSGGVAKAMAKLLERVRDDQKLDLSTFDVNSAAGPGPDGFFDGVILDTDIASAVAFPLAGLGNQVVVGAKSAQDPKKVTLGIVALAPPDIHEFAHTFGFIDLYGYGTAPTVNGLMSVNSGITLSAFSRQQVGWGKVTPVTSPSTIPLKPVLDGGEILRLGVPPRYLLIENRGGFHHASLDLSQKGIYVYSVDESAIRIGPWGFLDLAAGDLYLPNASPPYLNVNLPLFCSLHTVGKSTSCVMRTPGDKRQLVHEDGTSYGTLEIISAKPDDAITVKVDYTWVGPDAGMIDAGVVDAGLVDASADAAADAARDLDRKEVGPQADQHRGPDAGPDSAQIKDLYLGGGGCACRVADEPSLDLTELVFSLLLVVFVLKRRSLEG